MADIICITIKNCSGFGADDDAYDERLTITPARVSYIFNPANPNVHAPVKWSLKTNSLRYRGAFQSLVEVTPDVLHPKEKEIACDVGTISITVTYNDKTRETIEYLCGPSCLAYYFGRIDVMLPSEEVKPMFMLYI